MVSSARTSIYPYFCCAHTHRRHIRPPVVTLGTVLAPQKATSIRAQAAESETHVPRGNSKRIKESTRQQLTIAIKNFSAVTSTPAYALRPTPKQLDDLCAVVVVFAEQLALVLRIEQVLGRQQLEHNTRHTPDIRRIVPVVSPCNGFRRAILACLDIFSVVAMDGGRIAEVSNLDGDGRARHAGKGHGRGQ